VALAKLALIARLKDGTEERARELLRSGPPFDPGEVGLDRHTVFLSADEVVFVFEGEDVESRIGDLMDESFGWPVHDALAAWRPIVEAPTRIARPVFDWERP
jgi:hypothetical protein